MLKWGLFAGGIASTLLAGFAASYFYPGGFAMAQATSAGSGNVVNVVLLAVIMVLGIFASFVVSKAKEWQADKISFPAGIVVIFTDWQFISALFVSPLIFNSVYALTQQNPETLGDFLLSFQNGFFWQSVLSGITAAKRKQANAKPVRAPEGLDASDADGKAQR